MADDPTDPVTFEDYSAMQRSGYEAGDKAALLQMILICVQDQRPLPDWAGTAFENVYHRVLAGGPAPGTTCSAVRTPRERMCILLGWRS